MGAYILVGAAIIALVVGFVALSTLVLMTAWNASVAIIWGLPTLDFVQALSLYAVVWIIGAAFQSTLTYTKR